MLPDGDGGLEGVEKSGWAVKAVQGCKEESEVQEEITLVWCNYFSIRMDSSRWGRQRTHHSRSKTGEGQRKQN
jgi:hypothetical protein